MLSYTPSIFQILGTSENLDVSILSIKDSIAEHFPITTSILEQSSTNTDIGWLWICTLVLFFSGVFFFLSETIEYKKDQRQKLESKSDKNIIIELSQKRLTRTHRAA